MKQTIEPAKRERQILLVSFIFSAVFAFSEFLFAIFSRSQSVLMDAAYDGSELIFVVLTLFLTPLFHKKVTEDRPYGYFQLESVFLVIKGFMMITVSVTLGADVIGAIISGGHKVNGGAVALFQLFLCVFSFVILKVMRHMNRDIESPTVDAELLGWRTDVWYSSGMSLAFALSLFIGDHWIGNYVDSVIALVVTALMLPDMIRMLVDSIRDVFLLPPMDGTVERCRELTESVIRQYGVEPTFYDVTKTGRKIWIDIYFWIDRPYMDMALYGKCCREVRKIIEAEYPESIVQLILESSAHEEVTEYIWQDEM